ncbi:MAG: hypothetical protein N3B15_07315, partial [Planctomycetota bacterium]|nr:hypothetical protein [Planctomycetota bacterium]
QTDLAEARRLIPPQTWQRVVLGAPSSDKQRAIEWVRTHYPALNLTPGRRRKPHTGIADACCIAECMRRFLLEADHEPA